MIFSPAVAKNLYWEGNAWRPIFSPKVSFPEYFVTQVILWFFPSVKFLDLYDHLYYLFEFQVHYFLVAAPGFQIYSQLFHPGAFCVFVIVC